MPPETDKAISNLITNSHGCRAEAAKELYRLDAEVEQLRQQLAAQTEAHEKMYAMLCKRTDELAVVTLALETENQAATMYAQQVAHWIEKYDALRQRIDDAPVVAWLHTQSNGCSSLIRTPPSAFDPQDLADAEVSIYALISKEDLE